MANGTLKVSNIQTSSGSGTITLGQSGETVSVPSGATLDMSSGTMTLNSSMKSAPAFFSKGVSSSQAISDQTYTTLTNWNTPSNLLGTVTFSSGIVTPGTAGTYFFYAMPDIGNMADGDRAFALMFSVKIAIILISDSISCPRCRLINCSVFEHLGSHVAHKSKYAPLYPN